MSGVKAFAPILASPVGEWWREWIAQWSAKFRIVPYMVM